MSVVRVCFHSGGGGGASQLSLEGVGGGATSHQQAAASSSLSNVDLLASPTAFAAPLTPFNAAAAASSTVVRPCRHAAELLMSRCGRDVSESS